MTVVRESPLTWRKLCRFGIDMLDNLPGNDLDTANVSCIATQHRHISRKEVGFLLEQINKASFWGFIRQIVWSYCNSGTVSFEKMQLDSPPHGIQNFIWKEARQPWRTGNLPWWWNCRLVATICWKVQYIGPKLIFTFYCWDCCNHVFEHHNPLVRPYFLWVGTILNIIAPLLLKASLILSAIHFWFIQQGS